MTLISAKDIFFSFKKNPILQGISFQLNAGETLGIIGPNGAGKTSFLKVCAGFYQPQKGKISLFNKDLTSYHPRQRGQLIAFMPQEVTVHPLLKVRDIVALGRLPYKKGFWPQDRQRNQIIEAALALFHLHPQQEKKWYQLSGGQKQRTRLACAIAQTPELLILDEPVSHLDITYQFSLLSYLKQQNKAVILSLHDLNLAANYCDKLLLLAEGKMRAFGTPQNVITTKLIEEIFQIGCKITIPTRKNPHFNISFFDKN